MNECPKCHGGGLVGGGDKPWERVGHLSTCDLCSGTGKVEADIAENFGKAPAVDTEEEVDKSEGEKEFTPHDYVVDAEEGIKFKADDHTVVKGVFFGASPEDPEIVQFLAEGKIHAATDEEVANFEKTGDALGNAAGGMATGNPVFEKYLVIGENGYATPVGSFAKGEIVELDPLSPVTEMLVENKLVEKAVDNAVA